MPTNAPNLVVPEGAHSLDDLYDAAGYKYNVDPLRIKAHAVQETGERANVPSADGKSFGFGQFTPDTWARIMPGVPLAARADPETAIEAMGKFIAANDDAHRDPSGRVDLAASTAAYNGAGPAADAYAQKVQGIYGRLAAGGGLKLSGQAADKPGAAANDDAFGQTLKGSPKPATGDETPDAFAATLKGGPAKKEETKPAEAPSWGVKPLAIWSGDPKSEPTSAGLADMHAGEPEFTPGGGLPGPLARVGQAVAHGWRDTPNMLMTPEFRRQIEQAGPIGNYITSPLLQAAGAVPAAFNALGAGTTQAVNEATTAAGVPTLARDLNPLLMSAGIVMGGAPDVPLTKTGLVSRNMKDVPNPLAIDPDGKPVAPADIPTMTVRPGEAPQPAGAMVSTPAEAAMTPAQVAAYRSTAEGQKLLETQQPGIQDRNVYVPGVSPNEAEIEQTVNTARELKALNTTAPKVSQEAKETADANNAARQQHFNGIAGSDVDVANARAARAEQAQKDLQVAWANKKDADAQPVLDVAAEIKTSPEGRRPAVRNAVDAVTKELYDDKGELFTDPEQLYGVRKHIDDLLSKEGAATDPLSIRAKANLIQLKTTLDGVIEQAAPGFGQYLKNFSDASRPIDTMEVLQKHENKLYDAQSRMGYNRVQTMMRQIVDSRASADPVSPYKSIPDETMTKLWALRDDLRRSASAQELARTPGSDTVQNAWDTAKDLGRLGGTAVLHAGANALSPGLGSIGLSVAKNALSPIFSARTARRQTARGMEMLHPDPKKYPLRNPLQPP